MKRSLFECNFLKQLEFISRAATLFEQFVFQMIREKDDLLEEPRKNSSYWLGLFAERK